MTGTNPVKHCDLGINQLDEIAKQYDIDCSRAKHLRFSGKRIQR